MKLAGSPRFIHPGSYEGLISSAWFPFPSKQTQTFWGSTKSDSKAILQLLDHPTPHWRAVGNRGMIHDYEQSSVEVNHRKHQLLPPPPILAIPWTPLGRSGRGICQARPVLRGLVSAAYLQSTDPSRCWRCPRRAGLIVESLRKVGKSWKIYRPREHHFVSSPKKNT